jgi:succinate-semialdehyde dehydrogenase/glutarate-semialdehyde dehydrogenase
MQQYLKFYIDGEWVDPVTPRTLEVENPATEENFAVISIGSAADVDKAVAAAKRAFPSFSQTSVEYRADLLDKITAGLQKRMPDLAKAISQEMGAPMWLANAAQVPSGLGHFATTAAILREYKWEELKGTTLLRKEPIGVCAFITPWNWPLNQIACKVAPALAAGCTMVLKPASQTPFSALALAELAAQAGIPAGVFSVVTGSAGEVGGELTSNPIVRKLSFTGSTEIGRQLMAECAHDIKKVSLELGGNAPFIVFDDADLDAAVEGALISKYRNNGQTCVCANRLYVQDGVYDAFVDKLKAAVAKLKIGNGLEDGTTTGPLIDSKAVAKVEEHIADALGKGAKLALGGQPHALGGSFFEPTILVDVPHNAAVAREETFGPLAPVFRFKDEAEVIRLSNDTEFGLASYFYARDLGRVFRVAEALEYGMVGINTGLISTEVAPFGGVKASGLGREGSKYGIEDYLEIKYLCMGGVQ